MANLTGQEITTFVTALNTDITALAEHLNKVGDSLINALGRSTFAHNDTSMNDMFDQTGNTAKTLSATVSTAGSQMVSAVNAKASELQQVDATEMENVAGVQDDISAINEQIKDITAKYGGGGATP